MDHRIQLNLATTAVIVGICFAASFVAVAFVGARAYQARGEQALREDKTFTVKGSARQRITSDRAVWQIIVRGENKELKPAFASLDTGAKRVEAVLKDRGFADTQVEAGPIDTGTHYSRDAKGNETREITGYTLTRTITVTTPEVNRVAHAAGQVTQLIEEGILVESHAPEYYFTDLAKLKIDMMGLASKDSRTRADTIAQNAGGRIAEVRSAHMGVLQITRPFSTETSDGGVYDTSTIDKDVQAVVTTTFRVE